VDVGRLRSTEWILGAFGVALLGVMFLDWYKPAISGADLETLSDDAFVQDAASGGIFVVDPGTGSVNAWEAFAVTDIVLAAAAILAIAVAVVTATQRTQAIPVALESLTALLTLIASIFVFIRVLSVPGDGLVRDIGPVLGLPLILGLTLAAWFGVRNERPGHGAHARDARAHVAEIETLPAPEP
jgi:hypothetical protein